LTERAPNQALGVNQVRFRVSTALLLAGLATEALQFLLVAGPWSMITPVLLLVAFVAALVTFGVLAYRRNGRGAVQSLIEAGVSFGAFFLLPRY